MPATFEPRLDILPESQRRLWPELDAVPSDFVLYGGTALALQATGSTGSLTRRSASGHCSFTGTGRWIGFRRGCSGT